ncbi:DUF433 domain-containing protein, partial [Candidatus Poribacteria bacterium]|nr:DUF433 domain-containing protein [Candidatus Poribacteria bacterium]
MERIEFGKYVVADLEMGHSKLTFKGTRICVQDVLEMVADEMEWDEIIDQCYGSITKAAIAEAVLIASQVFLRKVEKPKERMEYGKYVVADPSICHG